MTGMYEKLGKLLNETLEAGHVKFVRVEKKDEQKEEQNQEPSHTADFAESFDKAEEAAEKIFFKTSRRSNESTKNKVIYKALTPELEKAYTILGLNVSATKEDLKKAYKEQLKYYHPDRYAGKDVMEKIATEKTRELVEAYSLLSDFIKK